MERLRRSAFHAIEADAQAPRFTLRFNREAVALHSPGLGERSELNPGSHAPRTRTLKGFHFPSIALAVAFFVLSLASTHAQTDTSQIQLGPSCITTDCHADLKQAPFLHGPVNLGQCRPCHEPRGNRHVFAPMPAARGELCLMCHQSEAPMKFQHAPYAADCLLCHEPHGSDNRQFVQGGAGADGCLRCHDDPRVGMDFLHGPVAMGECLVCHTAHQSDYKAQLVDAPAALCQSCHIDVQQAMEGAVSIHEPVKTDCSGCHDAHGGKIQFFLTAEKEQLCNQCHGEFLKETEKFKFTHQPMTEGKGCANCHNAHVSNQEKLLAGNNMELCLSCHDQPIKQDGTTLPSIAAQIQDSKFLHGPLRQENCIACHQAHGSDHPNILEKAFPENFYAPFEETAYSLCFECHDRQIVEHETGTLTEFRNGEVNLHFLHVNREKGRSCRACHHEHASNQPKHVRENVPFGRWVMELEYAKTPAGGGCTTGCHLPFKYDRDAPVDNKTVTP
jgi:predicted CXXCH cytochrome family protein